MFKAANYYFNGNKYGVEQNMEKDQGYAPGDFFSLSPLSIFKFKLRKSFSYVFASLYAQKGR